MPKIMTRFKILFTAFLALAVSMAAGASSKVELRVEAPSRSGQIEVGQRFYIKMIVSNISDAPSTPSAVPGAKIQYFGHQSSSSSFTSINGRTSQSVVNVYALTLKAETKGNFKFGPVTVGGVKSNTVSYTIVEAGKGGSDPYAGTSGGGQSSSADPASPGPQDPNAGPTFIGKGNDQLFLRASVSKTTAYEQEALVYTVKLYTTYGSIKFIGATDAPKFEGFVIEESNNVSNQLTYETYQGKTYATAIIARYIIFPQMAGKLKILGNKYTVSTDAVEYYHDPFFSRLAVSRPVQLNVTPNDLVVNVNPLPSPRPANFSGGVGKFNISSSLKSANVISNQAGQVSYTVTGEGNLKYIHLPDLNALYPDEIEVFSPSTDVKSNVGSTNVSGSVTFDYSFMPLEAGNFEIPAVDLVYFNPATGKYETATSRKYQLVVARGKEQSKSQATLTYNSKLLPVSFTSNREAKPYIKGFAYWLWYIIPTLFLVGAMIARRKYISLRADVEGLKSRRAGKMARRRLKRAMARMTSNDESGFYDEMLRALWGYLSEKLKLPTSELNRENVSQILAEHNIPEESVAKLLHLIDECEFAKYSPASSRRSMQLVYDEGAEMLNGLEHDFAVAAKQSKTKETKEDEII